MDSWSMAVTVTQILSDKDYHRNLTVSFRGLSATFTPNFVKIGPVVFV